MTRLKLLLLVTVVLGLITLPQALNAQSRVVAVDFERAVVQSAEGKKSSDKFNAALQAKQADVEKKQKEIEDLTKKLQNGARTLSDTVKADTQKDIDRKTLDLQRVNEDAQKELEVLRDELLRPIAQKATAILNAMAQQQGYTLVIDVSNPQNNVAFVNPKNDVTDVLIKAIDAETAKEAASAPAPAAPPKTPAPAAPRPATANPAPKPPAVKP
jgi:Skp family chaperone for outer membrane proteins